MSKPKNGDVTRREAVQLTFFGLGAILATTGCSKAPAWSSPTMGRHLEETARALFFSTEELAQLAEVAEIMIPSTDTPGARAANVHGFIDRMMAQWALPKTQVAFRALLGEINSSAKARFGARFMDLSQQHRFDVLSAMDAAAFNQGEGAGEVNFFSMEGSRQVHPFMRLKELVFLGFYQSEIGATQELRFELIPGRYEACVPLSNIGRAWAGEPASMYVMQTQVRVAIGGRSS